MRINTYLYFNGDCEEAFKFYERVLGGKIVAMMTHGGSPAAEHASPDMQDKIMHALLTIGDRDLMGSDLPPEYKEDMKGFSVALHVDDPAEADRLFNDLAEGGKVVMQIEQTFWAVRFGMLVDRFGTPWMVNCAPAEAKG